MKRDGSSALLMSVRRRARENSDTSSAQRPQGQKYNTPSMIASVCCSSSFCPSSRPSSPCCVCFTGVKSLLLRCSFTVKLLPFTYSTTRAKGPYSFFFLMIMTWPLLTQRTKFRYLQSQRARDWLQNSPSASFSNKQFVKKLQTKVKRSSNVIDPRLLNYKKKNFEHVSYLLK